MDALKHHQICQMQVESLMCFKCHSCAVKGCENWLGDFLVARIAFTKDFPALTGAFHWVWPRVHYWLL